MLVLLKTNSHHTSVNSTPQICFLVFPLEIIFFPGMAIFGRPVEKEMCHINQWDQK